MNLTTLDTSYKWKPTVPILFYILSTLFHFKILFELRSPYVAQADFELVILLPLPPYHWGYRYVSPHPAVFVFFVTGLFYFSTMSSRFIHIGECVRISYLYKAEKPSFEIYAKFSLPIIC
jgi:hypothetical protein